MVFAVEDRADAAAQAAGADQFRGDVAALEFLEVHSRVVAEECGVKGRAQAGDFASPYAPQSEWLLVLKRPGDRLMNHDNSPRGDIIRFAPVSVPHLAGTQQHAFEKPVELCKYLVSKHTHERELVFDACGCTGSMSVSAIETNRQWAYAESNAANYHLGVSRISSLLQGLDAAAG